MIIKTVVNTTVVQSFDDQPLNLLPPNDRRIALIVSSNGGAWGIKINSIPATQNEGFVVATTSNLINRNIVLSVMDLGTAIQGAINGCSIGVGSTVTLTEFLAAP